MKKTNFLMLVGALGGASIIYEAINSILTGIERTWSPANTDLIAKAIASGAWMIGLSLAAVLLSVGAVILKFSAGSTGNGGQGNNYKMIEGETAAKQPYMLTDNGETEYIGMESWAQANQYIDNDNNV